jgi:hypothetical protein
MIKFFRKIRQNLLVENKTGKYLKYAFGEIVLVVIGILIALQINNWNERKNNITKTTNILKEIQLDLINDIKNVNQGFDDFIRADSILELIVTNKYTFEDFKSKKANILGNLYFDFVIQENGYNNLMRNSDNLPEKYKPLLTRLNKLYVIDKSKIDVYNARIRKTVYDNLTYTNNLSWAQDWRMDIPNIEAIDYFLNDQHYRGSVLNWINDRGNIFSTSNRYKIDAIKAYKEIALLLPDTDTIPEIISFKNKDGKKENKLIGTYHIIDSLGQNKGKQIKVSKIENQLYLKLDDLDKFKINWQKEFIYFTDSGFDIYNFNKSDTLIFRGDITGNAVYVRD